MIKLKFFLQRCILGLLCPYVSTEQAWAHLSDGSLCRWSYRNHLCECSRSQRSWFGQDHCDRNHNQDLSNILPYGVQSDSVLGQKSQGCRFKPSSTYHMPVCPWARHLKEHFNVFVVFMFCLTLSPWEASRHHSFDFASSKSKRRTDYQLLV